MNAHEAAAEAHRKTGSIARARGHEDMMAEHEDHVYLGSGGPNNRKMTQEEADAKTKRFESEKKESGGDPVAGSSVEHNGQPHRVIGGGSDTHTYIQHAGGGAKKLVPKSELKSLEYAAKEKKEEPSASVRSDSARKVASSIEQASRKAANTPRASSVSVRKHVGKLSDISESNGHTPSEEDKKHLDNMPHVQLKTGDTKEIEAYIKANKTPDGEQKHQEFIVSHGGKSHHVSTEDYDYPRYITPLKGYKHKDSEGGNDIKKAFDTLIHGSKA